MRNFLLQNKKVLKNIIIWGLAYLTGVSLAMVYDYSVTGIEIVVPCLIALAAIVYYKAAAFCNIKKWDADSETMPAAGTFFSKRDLIICIVIGITFALTVIVGGKIDFYDNVFNDFSIIDIAAYPFLGLFFSAIALHLFAFRDKVSGGCVPDKIVMDEKKGNADGNSTSTNRFVNRIKAHPFVSLWILNFVCYLPYYLTFFPGNCGNDTWKSLQMIVGDIPWSNHHPVLFTGLMMVVVKGTAFLNSLTLSVGVFSFLQMVSLAATLAYLGMRICRIRVTWVCKVFAILMFALHPFVGMYSIYLSKDVLFSEIMVFLILKMYDVVKNQGEEFRRPKECVKIAVLFLLSCMLRNNGMYISIVMAVIFILLYKKYWKQILLVFVCVIGLFRIWQGPVFKGLGIEKQSFAEAASVPLQQVGYVLWEGKEFSKEDMVFLEELMPQERVKEVYQPGFTDPYKFDEEFNDEFLNANVGEFLKVWSHGLVPYFGEYVKAYLHQTLGYWYYGATNTVCTQGCTENTLGVAQIDVIDNLTGISLEPIFEKAMLAGRKAPIVCILGSMAMQMWMVFLLIIQYVRAGKSRQGIYLLPLVILWGTLLIATPAFCLLRYLYPIFLLWPFMIAEFFAEKTIR